MSEGKKFIHTTEAVQKGLNTWIQAMQKNLDKKNRYGSSTNNSGSLRQSIGEKFDTPVKVTPKFLISATLSMNAYGKQVDEGRAPSKGGSRPGKLQAKIRNWVKTKGIRFDGISQESTIYLITRKIHREGYKGTGFKSKVINRRSKKKLTRDIAPAVAKDFVNIMFGR